jgi:hypothetical protein
MIRTVFGLLGISAQAAPVDPVIQASQQSLMAYFASSASTTAYQTAVNEHPDCFEFISTDEQATIAISENRPCHDGSSKVHQLNCGHYVLCKAPALCGRNCQEASALKEQENPSLHCLLCFRGDAAREKKQHPVRWHELLLPKYQDPKKELEHMDAYSIILRPAQPVYLGTGGLLILPKYRAIVTLIAQLENNREEQLKERTRKLCASLGYSDQISKSTLDNLEILLCNHHMILHCDLRVIGTISFVLGLEFQGKFMSYINVSPHFDAPEATNSSFCLHEARGILTDLVARDKLEVCLAKLPRKYRKDKSYKMAKVSEVARRIRAHVLLHSSFSKIQKQDLFSYIIAACIQQALWQFKLHILMEEVCEAMNLNHEEQFETAPSIGESHSKAGYIEVRIRRFAANKDWKVHVGSKKDCRSKN